MMSLHTNFRRNSIQPSVQDKFIFSNFNIKLLDCNFYFHINFILFEYKLFQITSNTNIETLQKSLLHTAHYTLIHFM